MDNKRFYDSSFDYVDFEQQRSGKLARTSGTVSVIDQNISPLFQQHQQYQQQQLFQHQQEQQQFQQLEQHCQPPVARRAATTIRSVNDELMSHRRAAVTWNDTAVHIPTQPGPLPLGAEQCHLCRKMAGPPLPSPHAQAKIQASNQVNKQGASLRGVMCRRCDRFSCPACHCACSNCNGMYCRFCSTVSYSGQFEQNICFDCDSSNEDISNGMCD